MKNLVQDGRVLTFAESVYVHPSHTDGLINGGDVAVVGRLAGIAYQDAVATTDLIDMQMDGVFNVAVVPGSAAISVGETVYVSPTTAIVGSDLTGLPFGIALVAAAANATIPVLLFGATPGAIGAGS